MRKLFAAAVLAAFSFGANAANVEYWRIAGNTFYDYTGSGVVATDYDMGGYSGYAYADGRIYVNGVTHQYNGPGTITSLDVINPNEIRFFTDAGEYWRIAGNTFYDYTGSGVVATDYDMGGYSGYAYADGSIFVNGVTHQYTGPGTITSLDVINPNEIRFFVTTVPIPAAVWLFGSALAGLGWMRKKQTA